MHLPCYIKYPYIHVCKRTEYLFVDRILKRKPLSEIFYLNWILVRSESSIWSDIFILFEANLWLLPPPWKGYRNLLSGANFHAIYVISYVISYLHAIWIEFFMRIEAKSAIWSQFFDLIRFLFINLSNRGTSLLKCYGDNLYVILTKYVILRHIIRQQSEKVMY